MNYNIPQLKALWNKEQESYEEGDASLLRVKNRATILMRYSLGEEHGRPVISRQEVFH